MNNVCLNHYLLLVGTRRIPETITINCAATRVLGPVFVMIPFHLYVMFLLDFPRAELTVDILLVTVLALWFSLTY